MDHILLIVVVTIILLLIVSPALFFFRRSTDVTLKGDTLVYRYPFKQEEIILSKELKTWIFQEAYFLRIGKVYSINMQLKNGKWKSISSRFNADSFQKIYKYLETYFGDKRKSANFK